MPKKVDRVKLAIAEMAFKSFKGGEEVPSPFVDYYRISVLSDTEILVFPRVERNTQQGLIVDHRTFKIKVSEVM